MAEARFFQKGDFIKYDYKKESFGIFEGVDLEPSYQYTKKLSLACFYDPLKYAENTDGIGGWSSRPVLEVAKVNKPCDKTIDTVKEDSWWKLCNEEEKEQALKRLAYYGYEWDEKNLQIINAETKQVIYKIISPKLEYNDEEIKPITEESKTLLKQAVISKNSYSRSYGGGGYYQGGYYGNGYRDEFYGD